jgi:hypothetical protein
MRTSWPERRPSALRLSSCKVTKRAPHRCSRARPTSSAAASRSPAPRKKKRSFAVVLGRAELIGGLAVRWRGAIKVIQINFTVSSTTSPSAS